MWKRKKYTFNTILSCRYQLGGKQEREAKGREREKDKFKKKGNTQVRDIIKLYLYLE